MMHVQRFKNKCCFEKVKQKHNNSERGQELPDYNETEGEQEGFETEFNQLQENTAASSSGAASSVEPTQQFQPSNHMQPTDEDTKRQVEKSKVAIQKMRKCHGSWDRAKRDWQGVLKSSASCPNTSGTKIETDIKELITTCVGVDEKAMAIETSFLTAGVLTDAEIQTGASLTTEFVGHLEEGKKKAAALKPWFQV